MQPCSISSMCMTRVTNIFKNTCGAYISPSVVTTRQILTYENKESCEIQENNGSFFFVVIKVRGVSHRRFYGRVRLVQRPGKTFIKTFLGK